MTTPTTPAHPLGPLTEGEIRAAVRALGGSLAQPPRSTSHPKRMGRPEK